MNLSVDRCRKRWYPLKRHPVQMDLIRAVDNGVRFPLVPAGRRSGKTERFKRYLAKAVMSDDAIVGKYFAAAPTHDQAKKIFWDDLKSLTYSCTHPHRPSESERIIYMPNGCEIHVIGLDRPERFEGVPWVGGGIDEIANLKPEAVNENIMPALDTENPLMPDYHAWCWFIGVPDGLGHYYDMCQDAITGKTPDAKVFHWKSSEILSAKVIEAAKARMSARQFRQEYEASFETAEGKIYDEYTTANHTDRVLSPDDEIMWCHDQNYTPLSSAVCVEDKGDVFIVDEIVLTSAVSRQSAQEFVERYKDHRNKVVTIYGDPAGKAGEKHGQASAYTDIEAVLNANGWRYTRKVKASAPAIKDRQNSVRAKIKTADGKHHLFVNPHKAIYANKGLSTCQLKKGSAFLEDDSDKYQHITTAIGYMIDYEWPVRNNAFTTGQKRYAQ